MHMPFPTLPLFKPVSVLLEVRSDPFHPVPVRFDKSWHRTTQTIFFHNNLPYFGYPDWESVTLCKYQHYPTLHTYISLSFLDQKRITDFEAFDTALFKINFSFMFFLKLDNMK